MKNLSFTKRVVILLVLLTATGLFLLWYCYYTSDIIKDAQAKQNVIAYRFLNSEWTVDNSMLYVALKDDSSGQYFLGKKKSLDGEYISIEAEAVKNELDYLYGVEQKNIKRQYASGFAFVFIMLSMCTLMAGVFIRMIFKKAIQKG